MKLRRDQIITLIEFIEDFVQAKININKYNTIHDGIFLEKSRNVLEEYINELVGKND